MSSGLFRTQPLYTSEKGYKTKKGISTISTVYSNETYFYKVGAAPIFCDFFFQSQVILKRNVGRM